MKDGKMIDLTQTKNKADLTDKIWINLEIKDLISF